MALGQQKKRNYTPCAPRAKAGSTWRAVLGLRDLGNLTPGVVESITSGQAAKTLTHITIKYTAELELAAEDSLRAVDMLRLVTGCPKLEDLSWFIHEELHDRAELDEEPLQAIEELLKSRGGNTDCYAIGEWNQDELDPDCIFD